MYVWVILMMYVDLRIYTKFEYELHKKRHQYQNRETVMRQGHHISLLP